MHPLPPNLPIVPRATGVIALFSGLLIWAGYVIAHQRAVIDAIPAVSFHEVDDRTEDVRRGPVKTTTRTAFDPATGKKVSTEKISEAGPVEIRTDTHAEKDRTEVPARRTRVRYVGLGIDPLAYARLPRLRAGVTVFGALDLGVAYDARFSPTGGAFQMEMAYRF